MPRLFFLLCSLMVSCSHNKSYTNKTMVTLGDQYNSTGVARYFLDDIPKWANFDQSSNCFRSREIRYFHLASLMKSFMLTYSEALNLQGHFNHDRYEFLSPLQQNSKQILSIKDEEVIFYKSLDKVKNKLLFFYPPAFSRIHLIWFDEATKHDQAFSRLMSFLSSPVHDEGVPILISACFSKEEIEARFVKKLRSFEAVKIIGQEFFSGFNSKGELEPRIQLELNEIFNSSQTLILYSQEKKSLSDIFKGKVKIMNY